ncbi:phospholipase D-like domain-containing protein, partial [Gammaproteobacteria bacterium]|nr:phospholipase D-like domain-containing protein [Gammaproteobacteria bacterium]
KPSMMAKPPHWSIPFWLALFLFGCVENRYVSLPTEVPEDFVGSDYLSQVYDARRWVSRDELTFNPIGLISSIEIPINSVEAKIIGPAYEESLRSLAIKLWLIDRATYSIDLVYYIFKPDRVGNAVLGALCNAVRRGVDIRVMIDSVGSFGFSHEAFVALEACAASAEFIRKPDGSVSDRRARVQFVVINAISNVFVQLNRRSHDKLLVIDGLVPENTVVMTGGRNMSADYYGIDQAGREDPNAYQDLELVLRAGSGAAVADYPLGRVATSYFSALFLHVGNRRVRPRGPPLDDPDAVVDDGRFARYAPAQQAMQDDLEFLMQLPLLAEKYAEASSWFASGFVPSDARLAHDLSNLTNDSPIQDAQANIARNRNSIAFIAAQIRRARPPKRLIRIVSPYFFFNRFVDEEGEVTQDGAKDILDWLRRNPEARFELITNSVLTSDNFFTQAIIDINELPRVLLTPDLAKQWRNRLSQGEQNPDVVESLRWLELINHPRVAIYQTGGIDSSLIGGDVIYGKLHAKFAMMDDFGFVGTSNFDHRSRLFNNEIGFYFDSDALGRQLDFEFEWLKKWSLRWGSAEWLAMREKLRATDGIKGLTTRWQRSISWVLNALGIEWLL